MRLLLLATLLALTRAQPPFPLPEESPSLTPSICTNPPTSNVSLPAYFTGRWHQLYTAGFASRFSSNRCVTANYTLNADNTVKVLNCQTRPGESRAECVVGEARPRDSGISGQLEVRFPPGPFGDYNVAALVGDASYGYFAAAVFGCDFGGESYFIIGRTPFMSETTLTILVEQLKEKGYPVDALFERTDLTECTYFDAGFDVAPPSPPPVPGAAA